VSTPLPEELPLVRLRNGNGACAHASWLTCHVSVALLHAACCMLHQRFITLVVVFVDNIPSNRLEPRQRLLCLFGSLPTLVTEQEPSNIAQEREGMQCKYGPLT
jgi:hypothetical protein